MRDLLASPFAIFCPKSNPEGPRVDTTRLRPTRSIESLNSVDAAVVHPRIKVSTPSGSRCSATSLQFAEFWPNYLALATRKMQGRCIWTCSSFIR